MSECNSFHQTSTVPEEFCLEITVEKLDNFMGFFFTGFE